MSLLGRIYVLVAATIFVLLASWALWTLRENSRLVEVVFLLPSLSAGASGARQSVELSVGALLMGWVAAGSVILLVAARAPYRIRATAQRLRRIRELEKEVQTLRVLPLRQHEEDELLAQEARLDLHERRVMSSPLEFSAEYPESTDTSVSAIQWASEEEGDPAPAQRFDLHSGDRQ